MAQKENKAKKDSIDINLSVKKKSLFVAISVALNIAVIAAVAILAVMHSAGAFDGAYIGLGFNAMCEGRWYEELEGALDYKEDIEYSRKYLAIIDYRCEKEGARKYFYEGLAEYFESLGMDDTWAGQSIRAE